jgi:hypothetical protein
MMIFIRERRRWSHMLHDIKYLANIWRTAPSTECCECAYKIFAPRSQAQTLFMLFYSSDNGAGGRSASSAAALSHSARRTIFLFPAPLFFYLKGLAARPASYIIAVELVHCTRELNRTRLLLPAPNLLQPRVTRVLTC